MMDNLIDGCAVTALAIAMILVLTAVVFLVRLCARNLRG
jgi:hypothetical protein